MPAASSSFRKMLILGIVLFFCMGQVNLVHADPQGPIQDAINAAPAGGTVDISAGTYSESLVISKNITLRGASSATTLLQPAGSGQRVIRVTTGNNLRLENLTVTGGNLVSDVGGGVYLENGGLELVSCVVSNNSADYGGGVFQAGSGGYLIATDSQVTGQYSYKPRRGPLCRRLRHADQYHPQRKYCRLAWRRSPCDPGHLFN